MIIQSVSNCTVCGNEFPYRKSKQFCSNACKQQAYLKSKAGIPLQGSSRKEMPTTDFSFTEFAQFSEEHGNYHSFLFYCFLRRNLSKLATVDTIYQYINSFFIEDDAYEKITGSKAYQTFREEFLSAKFTVGP